MNQNASTSSWGAWGTVAYDIGQAGSFDDIVAKSITSWRQQKSPSRGDVDGTAIPLIQVSNYGGDDPISVPIELEGWLSGFLTPRLGAQGVPAPARLP